MNPKTQNTARLATPLALLIALALAAGAAPAALAAGQVERPVVVVVTQDPDAPDVPDVDVDVDPEPDIDIDVDPEPQVAGEAARQDRARAREELDAALALYEEGREFVNDDQWARAEAKFNEVITKHAKSRIMDRALYYYGYSLKKQNKLDEALRALERLAAEFPKSRWVRESEALRFELMERLGRPLPQEFIEKRNDEMKIVALQSICSSSSDRCIQQVTDILKPGSSSSSALKQYALIFLGQTGDARGRDILLNVVRTEKDEKLRRQAVVGLSHMLGGDENDQVVFEAFKNLALAQGDPELSKFAVSMLANDGSPRTTVFLVDLAKSASSTEVRKIAIVHLGHRDDPAVVPALVELYDTSPDRDIRRYLIQSFAHNDDQRTTDKLVKIAREDADPEMRRVALVHLSHKEPARIVPLLREMYDKERDESTKARIIDTFGQISSKEGVRALIDIAKREQAYELKKKAIFWIGQSDDPEAQQYIESLLK